MTITPDNTEVFEAIGKDFLRITYTRLPKPMIEPDILPGHKSRSQK